MSGASARFRFRPARPGLAAGALVLGAGLAVSSLVAAAWGWAALGAVVLILALLYFASPAWRTTVRVDDDALEVHRGSALRFRLPWGDIVRVATLPRRHAAFVDGGSPDRSLLLPGRRAPYRIENQPALYSLILSRVPPSLVSEVERL